MKTFLLVEVEDNLDLRFSGDDVINCIRGLRHVKSVEYMPSLESSIHRVKATLDSLVEVSNMLLSVHED